MKSPSISLSVVFGNPRRSCSGSGICKVVPANALRDFCDCQVVPVKLEWSAPQLMRWTVDAAKLCTKRRKLWQRTQRLIVSQEFAFPLWFTEQVGQAIRVPVGQYPICFLDNEQLQIELAYEALYQVHKETGLKVA